MKAKAATKKTLRRVATAPRSRSESQHALPAPKGKRAALDRHAWIEAARAELVAGGIAAVKIGKLAAQLDVTREAFYWHFNSLQELQDELLVDWDRGNEDAYKSLLETHRDAEQAFQAMEKMWIEEAPYSPAWDSAMRDWARISKKADRVVKRVDARRIDLIQILYRDMGYDEIESLVRARIVYFHQVGYYTIRFEESREERASLLPVYLRILRGHP